MRILNLIQINILKSKLKIYIDMILNSKLFKIMIFHKKEKKFINQILLLLKAIIFSLIHQLITLILINFMIQRHKI
jgi:hypothetical protein